MQGWVDGLQGGEAWGQLVGCQWQALMQPQRLTQAAKCPCLPILQDPTPLLHLVTAMVKLLMQQQQMGRLVGQGRAKGSLQLLEGMLESALLQVQLQAAAVQIGVNNLAQSAQIS